MSIVFQSLRMPKSFKIETSGVTSIMFALSCTVLMGLVALAIDYSHWLDRKADMQSNADSAALAGARQLAINSGSTRAIQVSEAFLAAKNVQPGTYQIAADLATGNVSVLLALAKQIMTG